MAYAGVASLSETIHLILNYHQHSISPVIKNKITSLHKHIVFLQSFLEDFPDEAITLEERIREVTNSAEDIIELLLSDSLRESTFGSSKSKFKKGRYELHYDFDELKRISEEIESIAKGVKERHRETVGSFNDDLMKIISQLRGGPPGLKIIPIFGTGGIGKTTLARTVYRNPLIVRRFAIRAWVTVTQNYSWRGIISGLLSSINMLIAENMSKSDEELITRVQYILQHKRYLIVLDDLWSVGILHELKSTIPHNFNRSRILITTRLLDVASCVGFYSPIHEMQLMDMDQSWNLLQQKIFNKDHCPPKLEHMGKLIAGSCRGLPLSIEVVSGILAADQTEAAWEDIAENVNTAINLEDDEHLFHILHLSYTYLPHHLRPCFLYLGIFPEDHEIRVSKLIKLWVAEGFLNQSGSKSFEETAEEYLKDLVKRKLVKVSKRKSSGSIKSLRIHDLIRDLCTRQAQVDNFFLHVTKFLVAIQLQRRVSVADYDDFLQTGNGSTIRTILCLEGSQQGIRSSLEYFRLLRILDFSAASYYSFFNLNDFPSHVFELFHVRYLAFSCPFNTIPKAISNLENLQTLIIRPRNRHRRIVKLPVEIWRMRQLRHVVVHSCELPSQEEEAAAMFALENLQTLTEVINFICSRETMKMIPNLKKLGIFYTELRDPEEDYELQNLAYLPKLEILKIEMYEFVEEQDRLRPGFPPTLKKLSLSGLKLPWEDMKIVGSLPNLRVLKLRNNACIGSTWETSEGGFSYLNFLLIHNSDLEYWITETSHFPRLKWLVLHHCRRLRKVPNDFREIMTLELVEVDDIFEFRLLFLFFIVN